MSDLFKLLTQLGALVLVVGMIKPAWFTRQSNTPSRRRIAVITVSFIIVTGLLYRWTLTPEQLREIDTARVQKEVANQKLAAAESSQDARILYTYYKRVDGNQDHADFDEQQYVRGQVISKCNVNGSPRGIYGWIEFRTILLQGNRIKNDPPIRMYVFTLTSADGNASVIWRGEEEKQAVLDDMRRTCD